MSLRYLIEDLQRKRDAAGLGTLSLGTAGISGEMVSSTPIPDSRCGGPGSNVADYGGYLVGEGMTPAVARYLASLHNAFPNLCKCVQSYTDLEVFTVGMDVVVYDRYRSPIPMKGIVVGFDEVNNGVQVCINHPRAPKHLFGTSLWVDPHQLRNAEVVNG